MKSFFKKLAFVMALAMVVTSAAPAAAGAAEEIIIVPQTGEAVQTQLIVFTEGDEPQDFRFLNAPANWRETYKWTTADPAVATVDTAGVVTPVAVGKTTLQFWLEGEVVASAPILVNPVSKVDEFALTQKSDTQLTATFTEASKLDVNEDVQLYVIYLRENGDEIVVPWPANKAFDDAKKVLTITPTVALGHNDHYRLVAGTYTQDIVTKIEKVDSLKLKYPANVVEDKFYIDTEYVITPTMLAGDVDLTALCIENAYDIEYTVVLADETAGFTEDDFEWYKNEDTLALEITIYEEGLQLAIGAKLIDENEKTVTKATASATGAAKPAWSFDGKVVDWAIIEDGHCCVDWDIKSIPADKSPEGEYSIVLKFKDGAGKTYVTHPNAKQEGDINHAGNYDHKNAENILIDRQNDAISKADYEVFIYSTDSNKMLVDAESGEIGVYTPADVAFYVKLVHYDDETDKVTERYIYAETLKITEATKLDEVFQIDGNGNQTSKAISIVKDVLPGEDTTELSKNATFKVVDQYDDAWGDYTLSAYYYDKDNKKVDIVKDSVGNTITFASNKFTNAGASEVKVTVVAKSTAILAKETAETTVTVKIVSPNYNDDKTTIKLDSITKNRYYTYYDVVVKGGETDVKLADDATDYQVSGTIQLFKVSNGVEVGLWRENEALEQNKDDNNVPVTAYPWVAITEEDDIKEMTEEGSKYIVMRDPSGEVVELNWNASGDKLVYKLNEKVDVAGLTDDKLVYAAEGTYTVEAVIVRHNKRNGNTTEIVKTATVNVKDTTKDWTIAGTKSVFKGADCLEAGTLEIDEKAVVMNTFTFKFDGKTLTELGITEDEFESWIYEVKAVKLNKAVIVQYIVLHLPVADVDGVFYEYVLEPKNPVYIVSDNTTPQ